MKRIDVDAADRLAPEAGWQPLHGAAGYRPSDTFFVPSEPDDRLCLRLFLDEGGGIAGKAWFGPGSQGPPGHVHGGAQAAVLDHALGAAAWTSGRPCFTASLTYDFRRMVPLGSVLRVEARVERVDERKVYTCGRLFSPGTEGETEVVFGEGRALFILMSEEGRRLFMERALDMRTSGPGHLPQRAEE